MLEALKQLSIEDIKMLSASFLGLVAGLVSIAELVCRFTKTKKHVGVLTRIGTRIDRLLDLMKVPNRVKDDEGTK